MIISLHKFQKSNREIAAILKISRKIQDYNENKYIDTNSFVNKTRTGRPRKSTKSEDNFIALTRRHNRKLKAPEITEQFKKSR